MSTSQLKCNNLKDNWTVFYVVFNQMVLIYHRPKQVFELSSRLSLSYVHLSL